MEAALGCYGLKGKMYITFGYPPQPEVCSLTLLAPEGGVRLAKGPIFEELFHVESVRLKDRTFTPP